MAAESTTLPPGPHARASAAGRIPRTRPAPLHLDPDLILAQIRELAVRIRGRFPTATLADVCDRLTDVAEQARARSVWIAQPILTLRIGSALLIALIVGGLLATVGILAPEVGQITVVEFVQILEAGINDVVLIGAAVFFLLTIESRIKRGRALDAIHELRSLAHIVDMLQLKKDPARLLDPTDDTSPGSGHLDAAETSRYLDYSSEMLALIGKIAALYVRDFNDSVALAAVNEIEDLTTGLSRKIWQKLMILHMAQPE